MSKKTKTTTNETRVMTPNNPAWVTSGMEGLAGKITNYGNLDPYSLVAGPDALQTQAAKSAAGLTSPTAYQDAINALKGISGQGANTYAPSMFGGADLGAAQQAQSASLLDNLQQYMSPYTKDVVDTSLADYDVGAGQTRAQQALEMAGSGAFGGSGSAITRSMTEDALTRGRGSLSAGLRDQGFQRGAALSSEDADRRQQNSQFNAANDMQRVMAQAQLDQQAGLANQGAMNQAGQFNASAKDTDLARQMQAALGTADIAGQQGASDRANIALQGDLGAQMQQLAQQRAQAPTNQLINQAGLFGSLPLNLLRGETTNSTGTSTSKTSDPMGALGSLAMLAAAPFTGGTSLLGGLGGLGAAAATAGKVALAGNAAKSLFGR